MPEVWEPGTRCPSLRCTAWACRPSVCGGRLGDLNVHAFRTARHAVGTPRGGLRCAVAAVGALHRVRNMLDKLGSLHLGVACQVDPEPQM